VNLVAMRASASRGRDNALTGLAGSSPAASDSTGARVERSRLA